MSDLKTAQEMLAAAAASKQNVAPELASVTQLLKSLDRASKNVRTFGHKNSVAQKFFNQFYTELTSHLSQFDTLTFVVQREGLLFKEEVVYGSQSGDASENFAFKLYSDGIREITFHYGIEEEDVLFFFDALWGAVGAPGTEDDDIVTRLWTRNLPTLTVVTADEVMKFSELDDVLTPQGETPSDTSLRELIAEAKAKSTKPSADSARKPKLTSGVTGYNVSEEELAVLAKEIQEESRRDNMLYVLDILTAVLSSEKSPELLGKLLDIYENILKSLFQDGHWMTAEHVLGLLYEAEAIREDLTEAHKDTIRRIFEQIGSHEFLELIEHYLNTSESPRTDGLSTILLMMKPASAPVLCMLLSNLEQPAHQAIVINALSELARETPEVLTKYLTDRRPAFVRNLLGIILRWNEPRLADSVERIFRYPDPLIRREAVRTWVGLKPNGTAAKLISLLNDPDEAVILATLKPLLTGQYTAPFSTWEPIVQAETFGDRPPAERRNIFHAMRLTSGDEAVPYWTGLLTEWGWTNRKKKEDLALMAIDALGKLGSAAAYAALETGAKKGNAAVKQACAAMLAGVSKQQRTS